MKEKAEKEVRERLNVSFVHGLEEEILPGAQTIKHLPAMRETRVRSLGWEDLLEKEMATHSSTLAWKIPWTEEPGRLQSMGSQKSQTRLSNFTLCFYF